MGDDNDLQVAKSLARIETLLEGMQTTVKGHETRLSKLEVWFIKVSTALVVWTFFTGSGPASLGAVIEFLAKKP